MAKGFYEVREWTSGKLISHQSDRDDADLDAREYPEPDLDTNGAEDTVPCPYCRRHIYEEAERCSYCGQYLSQEEDAPLKRPPWMIIGALICLAIVLIWILGKN